MTRYLLIGGKRYEIEYDSETGDYTIGAEASPADVVSDYPELVDVTADMYGGTDTNLSIEEIYNKLKLTCEQDEISDLISSPLEESDLYSPYSNSQKYCTEIVSWGEGENALHGFIDMVTTAKTGKPTTSYSGGAHYDHFVQLWKSHNWTFNGDKYIDETSNKNQWRVLQRARANTCIAFLASFGHTEMQNSKDNSIPPKPDMKKKYLVIALNGNRYDKEPYAYPNEADLQASAPIATYTGSLAGGYISPADSDTTNYIVFKGSFILCSSQQHSICMSGSAVDSSIIAIDVDEYGDSTIIYAADPQAGKVQDYPEILEYAEQGYGQMKSKFWHETIHLKDEASENQGNPDGAYYTCVFYENETPQSPDKIRLTKKAESLYPYNSNWTSLAEIDYNYSANWNSDDQLFKLPLIQCTLQIGDKYACEIDDEWGRPTFKWLRYEDCPVLDGVVQNHIWLGPNPKIGDKLISNGEMKMCNTVDATVNLDIEGLAIPVTQADSLSGKIIFTIDGVANLTHYPEITRRHPHLFRHTQWTTTSKSILSHCNMVLISDFECKVYTDNANINNVSDETEIIYETDEVLNDFSNSKDDISFRINTALTTQECKEKNIKNSIKMNNPWVDNGNGNGNELLRSVYNTVTENQGKPEDHYLTNHYKECSSAKLIVDTEFLRDREYDWLSHYQFDTLPDKEFMVQSITYNVKNSIEELKLKEIATNTASPVISISNNTLSISCSTVNATIYYTTDGTTPDINSSVYTSPISLSPDVTTIKAVAIKSGNSSAVVSESFSYVYNVAAPVISHEWESFTITCATPGATIYYTTDGSTPDETSREYVNRFARSQSAIIKAVAIKNGEYSLVTTFDFVKPERPQLTVEMNIDYENGTATITADMSEFQAGQLECHVMGVDTGEQYNFTGPSPLVVNLRELPDDAYAYDIGAYAYVQWYGVYNSTSSVYERYYADL